jgi:hypothetical protein
MKPGSSVVATSPFGCPTTLLMPGGLRPASPGLGGRSAVVHPLRPKPVDRVRIAQRHGLARGGLRRATFRGTGGSLPVRRWPRSGGTPDHPRRDVDRGRMGRGGGAHPHPSAAHGVGPEQPGAGSCGDEPAARGLHPTTSQRRRGSPSFGSGLSDPALLPGQPD